MCINSIDVWRALLPSAGRHEARASQRINKKNSTANREIKDPILATIFQV